MSIIKSALSFAGSCALILSLAACADENPWANSSGEKGSIELNLSADYSFDNAAPLSRGDADAVADLKTYTDKIPAVSDFSICLEKADGTKVYDWASFDVFSSYVNGHDFDAGLYTITAYSGKKDDVGPDKPYFEAKSTFTILAGRKSTINLNAQLKNAMVVVNYTQKFKDYMASYSSSITTSSPATPSLAMQEGKAVFVPEGNTNISVNFTTRLTQQSADISTGVFPSLPKTLRNITFDVVENDHGASLNITFDERLDGHKDVTIDLTQDLYTTPAPVINCSGFADGETVNTTGDAAANANIAMSVLAEGGIKSALLSIKGPDSYTQNWGAQQSPGSYQIDLASVSDLSSFGIASQGFTGGSAGKGAVASLNLSQFVKNLPQGHEYAVSLVVTDFNGKSNEPVIVKINSEELAINRVAPSNTSSPEASFNSDIVNVSLAYNGEDPKEITFRDANNYEAVVQTISYNGETIYTRAFESKVYQYELKLKSPTTLSAVSLSAYKGNAKIAGDINIPVKLPAYTISEFDAFATYAHLKVVPQSTDDLGVIMNNIKVYLNNSTSPLSSSYITKTTAANNEYGIITISGLSSSESSGTPYSVTSAITTDDVRNPAVFPGSTSNSVINSFTTEPKLPIPNGNFTEPDPNKELKSVKTFYIGFGYGTKNLYYTPKSSFLYKLPKDWGTINDKTAYENSTSYNSWYVVPSSWLDEKNQCAFMRNVGYNNEGKYKAENKDNVGTGKTYCDKTPDDLIPAAGEIFLGSYSYTNKVDNYDEGCEFLSRPTSIDFNYEYKSVDNDNGYARVEILDISGGILYSKSISLSATSAKTLVSIPLIYNKFKSKAGKLRIKFKSSDSSNPPIIIPTGKDIDEGTGLSVNSNNTRPVNDYKSVATGSELKIYNVKANY